MRTKTIALLLIVISFVTWQLTKTLMSDYSWLTRQLVSVGAVLVISGFLYYFSEKLRLYRKAHGRDIEDEERYEDDDGLISIRPTNQK